LQAFFHSLSNSEILFSPKVSDAYAEETKQTVTIKDAEQQAAEEAIRVDEHTANIKKSVKKDTLRCRSNHLRWHKERS
jgi:hypothetical protein